MDYTPSVSPVLALWNRFGSTGAGRWFVSKLVCFKAPFFNSIKPRFRDVRPGRVEVFFRNRRSVQNHLKSVHAIAMCNAAELAGGVCLDASLSAGLRWIPVGMEVQYLKMAKTDLRAICEIDEYRWTEPQDVVMPVRVLDANDNQVFRADITMRISERKTGH